MGLLIAKILIAVVVVHSLALVCERLGSRTAGLISGLPVGTALFLFFFGIEQGPEFAAESAVYNVAGFIPTQTFLFAYFFASAVFRRPGLVLSTVVALLGYLVAGAVVMLIEPPPVWAIAVTVLSTGVFAWLFRRAEVEDVQTRVRLSWRVLTLRTAIATAVILTLTACAATLGPRWSGLLSSFPNDVFPLMIVLYLGYGQKQVYSVIRFFPQSLVATILYSATVSLAYPAVGVYLGTVLAYGVAGAYVSTLFFGHRITRHALAHLEPRRGGTSSWSAAALSSTTLASAASTPARKN